MAQLMYCMILFMLLSCDDVTKDPVVKKPYAIDSIVSDSQTTKTRSSAGSIATVQYTIIDNQYLEIRIENNSGGAIALIPTLYSLAVMEQNHHKATAGSIGAIVYWDTATAGGGAFEILEPGPRYQMDLPVTVVEIAMGQIARIQFPIEQISRKVKKAERTKVRLEYLPVWAITSEFSRRFDRSCMISKRNLIRMCSSDPEAQEMTYKVCGAKRCTISSRELYDWLRSEVQQVPAIIM